MSSTMTPEEKAEQQYIKSADTENELINHRLGWLLAGQPLLFLAYANLVTAKLGGNEVFAADNTRKAAMTWVPLLGMGSALAVWIGVLGAIIAYFIITNRRPSRKVGVHLATTLMGFAPAFFIPLLFAIGWWAILLS